MTHISTEMRDTTIKIVTLENLDHRLMDKISHCLLVCSFLKISNKRWGFFNNQMIFVALNITPIGSLGHQCFSSSSNLHLYVELQFCSVSLLFHHRWGLYEGHRKDRQGQETDQLLLEYHFHLKALFIPWILREMQPFLFWLIP